MPVDPNIPKSVLSRIGQEQPRQENWSEDLQSLLSPSIQSRPLHLPRGLNIEKRLNREYAYFWARDRQGAEADHERVGQLRSQGFDFALSDPECKHDKCSCDVIMANPNTVKGKSEIRLGDLVLMKVPKPVWQGIRKQQQMDALMQTNSRSTGERSLMSTVSTLPGVRTENLDSTDLASLNAKKVLDDGKDRMSGNTTRFEKRS